jgi:hypothetical protein
MLPEKDTDSLLDLFLVTQDEMASFVQPEEGQP